MGYFLSVMKVLALLSLISFAAAVPTCQECNDSIGRLLARITGEESLAEQAAILTWALCPGAPDPDMCAASLPEQWPIIGGILFPEFLQADAICDDVGICYLFKEITCEDCEAGGSYVTGLMRDEGEVAAAVAFLQGDAYCGELIAALIPAAMDVLASAFEETSVEICQDVNG